MPKKAIVFKHLQLEGACNFGRILNEGGWDINTISVPRYGLDGFDALAPDLLVVMGGNIGMYQADDYPFLYDEMDVIKKRIDAGKPVLGVCLGAQMIANCLGANVRKGLNGKELGWYDLAAANDAPDDHPIHHLCAPHTSMFHWHGDTFDLPEGARLLASSENYENQAYEYGENIMALQCHPEVMHAHVKEWFVFGHDQIRQQKEGKNIHELREETAEKIDTLNQQGKAFLNGWLERIGLGDSQ